VENSLIQVPSNALVDAFPKLYGRKGVSCCLYAAQCRAGQDLHSLTPAIVGAEHPLPGPASTFPFHCGTVSLILRLGAVQEPSLAVALWNIDDVVPLRWKRNLMLA
jgi:hypothetical protein